MTIGIRYIIVYYHRYEKILVMGRISFFWCLTELKIIQTYQNRTALLKFFIELKFELSILFYFIISNGNNIKLIVNSFILGIY